MVPTLDEVRHIRGFGTKLDKAVKGSAALDFQWEKLEAFRDDLLSSIRDEPLRAFIAEVLAQRIDRHPLRKFTPVEARSLHSLGNRYAREVHLASRNPKRP